MEGSQENRHVPVMHLLWRQILGTEWVRYEPGERFLQQVQGLRDYCNPGNG